MTFFIGWGLIICGWCAYIIALASPAVEFGEIILDYNSWETKSGLQCFLDTLLPLNWIWAPLLFVYLLANLSILASPIVLAFSSRTCRAFGSVLLVFLLVTVTAPWCHPGIKGIYFGCIFWISSFFLTGMGFLFVSRVLCSKNRQENLDEFAVSRHGPVY